MNGVDIYRAALVKLVEDCTAAKQYVIEQQMAKITEQHNELERLRALQVLEG